MSFDDVTDRLRAAAALRETNETLERRVQERTAAVVAVNMELQQQVAERVAAEAAMREAKTAAEQANLSKTRFLAAASHDLLQPLNAARLFVSALATRRLAPANRTLVEQTGSALDSIEDLLEALLEISKLDAGAVTPEITDVPLGELMRALHAEFALAASTRGLTLTVEPTTAWVRTDARLLRRILQNFLSNALRYTRQGGVVMAARHEGAHVQIAVTDTGAGIDPTHHGEIFEEFRRLNSGHERGMGLGLAIVQRAGRMLDHPIGVRSAIGQGSTFCVTVPLTVEGTRQICAATPAARRGIAARTVLVIDNEEIILEGMRAVLEGWGCDVLTAVGGSEAREAIAASSAPVEVILADYHLGNGMTGEVVVAQLRTLLDRPTPAVIITADREPDLRDRLLGAGLHVLQKPVKPAQLRALLARLTG